MPPPFFNLWIRPCTHACVYRREGLGTRLQSTFNSHSTTYPRVNTMQSGLPSGDLGLAKRPTCRVTVLVHAKRCIGQGSHAHSIHQRRTQCLIRKWVGLGAHVPPCATSKPGGKTKVSCDRCCSLPESRPAAAYTTSTSLLETKQIPLLSPERKNNGVWGSW